MKSRMKICAWVAAAAFTGHVALAEQHNLLRVSQLLNAKVTASAGEKVGEIDELVIAPDGRLQFAVVGVGGVLGLGEKMTPIPFKALRYSGERNFTLNVDKQKLQSAPTLSKDQWSQINQPEWVSQVYTHYGLQKPDAVGGTGSGETKIESDKQDQQQD